MAWMKRLSAPLAPERKAKKFIVAQRGPHSLRNSVALTVLLRDMLEIAENYAEAKKIVKEGKILVDGKACKDHKFGIGLMDVVEIPTAGKAFRIVPSKYGLRIIDIPERERKLKLCRITGKKVVNKGRIQLSLHDGRNIIADNSYQTKDSVLIEIPGQKIKEHLKFAEGMSTLVIAGKNKSKTAKISKVEKDKVWLEENGKTFEAPADAVMIIGKDKPAITIEKNE